MLTFEEAKNQAERIAKTISLQNQLMLREPFLEELFLEEEHCWMFFVKELFDGQLNVVFANLSAIAVSKKGETRIVFNYYKDIHQAISYTKELSDYFLKEGL